MRKIEKALQPWLQDRILSSADGQLPSVQALGLGQLRVVREALRAAGRNSRVLNRNRIYRTKEVLYFDQFDLAFWLNFWLLLTQFPWRTPWSLALFPLRPPEFLSVWAEGLRWGRTQQALPTLSRSWSRLQTDISTFWANNSIYIHLSCETSTRDT